LGKYPTEGEVNGRSATNTVAENPWSYYSTAAYSTIVFTLT